MAPQKEGVALPDDQQVLSAVEVDISSEIEPSRTNWREASLCLKNQVKEDHADEEDEALGVTEMTLSNGAKVILKNTDFKNDEILFRASSPGDSL